MKNKMKRFCGLSAILMALFSLIVAGCSNGGGNGPTLTLQETSVNMELYGSYTIKYTVNPADSEVVFGGYDESIVYVSDEGEVKGLKAGSTNVTVSIKDTTVAQTLAVTVVNVEHTFDVDLPEPINLQGDGIYIHYYRKDGKYKNWNLWLWEGGKDGAQFDFNCKDDWGVIAAYPLSTWVTPLVNQLGFIVRKGEWESKDVDSDRFVDFSLYEKDDNGVYHIYLRTGDPNIYLNKYGSMRGKIELATFANMTNIALRTNLKMISYIVKCDGEVIYEEPKAGKTNYQNFKLPNNQTVDFTKEYTVEIRVEGGETLTAVISKNLLFGTEEFGAVYNYTGELGVLYTKEKTTFKVWSPFSSSIKLNIYDTGTPASLGGSDTPTQSVDMVKGEKGVFAVEVNGDLEGKYYTYVVTNSTFKNKEIVDPYAKSCGINGLRGMIVDFAKTNPTGWDSVNYLPYDRKELTIYETHIADVTSSKTWNGTPANSKLFKGVYESGTKYTEGNVVVSTGFDHIKELGVNAVQFIPIFDQANDERPEQMTFNWGYNPLNYNALEGGYSSNPFDGYARIKEFKELVKAYNEAGIEIIMDVVYNHVNGAAGSNFDVLLPGYYYRYTSSGNLSNGSGCGNETASDHYMMRKFIVDSIKFWISEYKLGGFRFDLMGLHDLTTMAEVAAEAKKINEHAVVFGEPWTGGDSPLKESDSAKQINGNSYNGYGAFNDHMRDALIKGGLNGVTELGWIDRTESPVSALDSKKLTDGIKGITNGSVVIADPDKTVNYVTCHDNFTLYDRFIATKKFTASDEEVLAKMNVLANSVVFTSQGTSFMLAGEEFLRTKGGDHNSYCSSYAVNELDYALKVKHLDMFETYKKLIAFKQKTDGLHLNKDGISGLNVEMSSDGAHVTYKIKDTANNREYMIIHSNGLESTQTFDLSDYSVYWSTISKTAKTLSNQTNVDKFETLIVYK